MVTRREAPWGCGLVGACVVEKYRLVGAAVGADFRRVVIGAMLVLGGGGCD
jgi:hypothetical protein